MTRTANIIRHDLKAIYVIGNTSEVMTRTANTIRNDLKAIYVVGIPHLSHISCFFTHIPNSHNSKSGQTTSAPRRRQRKARNYPRALVTSYTRRRQKMRLVTPSYLTLPTKVEDPIPSSHAFFVPASPAASPLSTPASIPHGLSVSEADVINPAVFHFPSAIIVSSGSLFPSRPIAEFLCHLTRMLSDPSHHSAIEWAERKIRVHDPRRLQNDVLRKFFRHSKYSSFQRQLNYFGFKKVDAKGKMSPCWFVNVDIDGDDLASLLRLRRKPAKKTRRSKEIHSSSI